jgi:hypothetical protein
MKRASGTRAILLVGAVMACLLPSSAFAQGSPPPSEAAASAPATSAAPASSEAPAGDAIVIADIERGAPLEAGRYVDTSIGRDISFDLGDGWTSDGPIPDAGLAIVRDEPGAPYLYIGQFIGDVFPPGCPVIDQDDDPDAEAFFDGVSSIDTTAAAFIEHLSGMAELTTTEAVPVQVSGYDGLQLDVSAVDVDDACIPQWAWLWVLPVVGDYHFSDGTIARVVALDADEQVVVVVMEAGPEADMDAFLAQGDEILASMRIGERTRRGFSTSE